MDEEDLIRAAARGEQEAFEVLVKRYRPYIYTIAYNIALNMEDALDITQNVLLRVVEKIGDFNHHGNFRSWLATITIHESVDHRRRPSRREFSTEPQVLAEIVESDGEHTEHHPRSAMEAAERRKLVKETLTRLSPQQRAILTLILFEEMRPKDIAEKLGIPPKQVSWQIHRGLIKIRAMLAGYIKGTEPR
ncbi:sigma-70 family RNA polymerase sigma factor [Candidatus Sumerlaeota bacterium]|nr:sigma-70 family RNA polymerase sigma factor [Candidatus Sumerlaeota bacterium]